MNDTMTSTIAEEPTYVSPEKIIEALAVFIRGPKLIGNLHGYPVYVDDSLPPAMIEIRAGEQTMRFSIEHPYIQGTSLEAAAREAVRSGAVPTGVRKNP